MKSSRSFGPLSLSKVYVVVALVVAGVLSPLIYAPIPLLTLLLYLYLSFRRDPASVRLPLILFIALSLPLFFEPTVGTWIGTVFVLPMIPLLGYSLRQSALAHRFGPIAEGRRPTRVCLLLALSLLIVAVMAASLSSWGLLLSCASLGAYLSVVIGVTLRKMSAVPVEADIVSHRVLAGDLNKVSLRLINRSGLEGQLFLRSSYPWFHIRPERLALDRPHLEVDASFTPPLAGPVTVEAWAGFLDPWGLVQSDFRMEMMGLFVIPRARYAEWLARRYLEMGRAGAHEPMASVAAATSQRASRRGIEYYGLRLYQPGDSPKTVDWKHTAKLQQLVVKEFVDTSVRPAIVVVNLSVADEEEKDKLAFGLITTALTLARENIPSAFSAYNHWKVVLTTPLLDPRRALLQALNLARRIDISLSPLRYLELPDMTRLRANMHRLSQCQEESATKLAQLLNWEYMALSRAAEDSPATKALAAALTVVSGMANIIILSRHNHDAEAITLNRYRLRGKGHQVLEVELGGKKQGALAKARI